MNQNKKGPPSQQLCCEVCEIDSMSNAEYALHEFTKKHCDNLIRSAKNKPILKKQKTKNKIIPEAEKETVKVNTVTHTGSFAKYGYFIPGEIYAAAKDPKEFSSDYDPYLQKFTETSFKDMATSSVVEEFQQQCITVLPPAANVSKKKKKKKSNIKMCQICNVTLLTIPLYEAHMKSPEHILKLKVSGMGVSAHFVKASSDLHTIETNEDKKVSQDSVSVNNNKSSEEYSLPSLSHCKTSELTLNSLHQYTSHVTDWFKKKVEEKEMLETPLSDKLFCYTCNILLNTVFQYNEHKHGKKHKIKCRALIRKGMTIPPEERVPGIGIPNNDSSQPVYPELYKKMISERQKFQTEFCTTPRNTSSVLKFSEETESCDQNKRLNIVNENTGGNMVSIEIQDEVNDTNKVLENKPDHESVKRPKTTFHTINFVPPQTSQNSSPEPNLEKSSMPTEVFFSNNAPDVEDIKKEQKTNITVLNSNESLLCSICNENFQWQFQFDMHLMQEDHFKKIVELKVSGKSDHDILSLIFSDRNIVKPNNLGKLICSICKVTADNKTEFEQHLNCIVHKYSEKDYKQKRTLEVKLLIPCDETGMYYCKLCKIKLASLIEFSQHFFSAKHKSIQKKKRTPRSIGLSQRQRFSQNLKRKYTLLRSLKADKNPDIGTKGSGLTTDLCTGAQSKVLNLELSDAKIEPTQNCNVALNEKSDILEAKNKLGESNVRKRQNLFKAGFKVQHHNLKQSGLAPMRPFLPCHNFRDFLPSTNFSRFPGRPPYRWYPSNVRNVPPLNNSHPPVFGPFCGRPSMSNPFYRPPCFERAPWRNYR